MKYITLLLCAVLYAISLTTYGQEIYVANDQQITKRIPPNEESGILIDNPIKVGEEVHIPYQNSQLHHVESHMVIHPSNPDHWLVTAMIITDPVAWNIEAAVWLTVDAGKNWSRKDFPKIFADPYLSIDDDGIVYFSGLGQSTKGDNNEYYYISKDGGKRWSNGQPVEGPHDHPFLITKGKDTFWWSTMKGNRQLNIRKAHKGEVFQSLKTIHFNDSFRHDNMIPALLGNDTLILPFIKYHSSYTGIDVEGAYFFTTTDGINIQGPERITNRTGSAKGLESMLVDNSESKYKGNLYFLYPLGDMRKSEGLELSISSDGGKLWREVTFRKPERGKRYYVPTGA
ncbi:MAG TPA: hypothetical protein VJ917_04705, partial [Saprospiraceae bacterium]|nr:hypothetical protein [Saprospiraceae bacterium]